MLAESPTKRLVEAVSAQLHGGDYFVAARLVADFFSKASGQKYPVRTKAEADGALTLLLQWCLNNNGYEEAAQMLWGQTLFDPRPDSTHRVWRGFGTSNFLLLMGAGSMSKSYSIGVRLFLEWLRDPEYTNIKVIGPSERHLEDNLFTHLVTLHRQSTIPLPGEINQLFIGLDPRERKSSISGVVVPLGIKSAGRLQGVKRVPRKEPHPIFGKLSRMFVFLDEIANIPKGIWRDIDNIITNTQGDGLKVIGAFNPTDQQDEVGSRTEPPGGWAMFDPDADFEWVSTRGWTVVRLDALYSENVVQKKLVFPGLQTYEGFQMLIRNSGGTDSPGYWAMGRGCFPPTGTPLSIIPSGLLADLKAEILWYDTPTPIGGVDLALQGADRAVFIKGSFGLATGFRFPPSLAHPAGRVVMFKDKKDKSTGREVILAEAMFGLPKGDTVEMANEVKRVANSFSIRPEHLCVDRTGHGQGVYDLLRFQWGEVLGVNYSESCNEMRIMVEDHAPPGELYDRINSELWFALRKFIEFGYCKLAYGLPTEDLFPQLTGRRYRPMGRKARVEKKEDYQSRHNGRSPDEADAFTLLIQAVRKGFGFIPGMAAENSFSSTVGDDDFENGTRVDCTNRFEDLDSSHELGV